MLRLLQFGLDTSRSARVVLCLEDPRRADIQAAATQRCRWQTRSISVNMKWKRREIGRVTLYFLSNA